MIFSFLRIIMVELRVLFFVLLISWISSCEKTQGDSSNHGANQQDKGLTGLGNREIFLQAEGISVVNFSEQESKSMFKSDRMFVCSGDQYFLEEGHYCVFFEKLWVQNLISQEGGSDSIIAFIAEKAYTNRDFSDLLLNQVTFSVQNSGIVLFSTSLHWQLKDNLLSSTLDSEHTMKNKKGDVLHGHQLVLDYRSGSFTMNNVVLKIEDSI